MNLAALLQAQADARNKALAIHKAALAANRQPTEQEQTDFNAAIAEANGYNGSIAMAREAQDLERNSPTIPAASTGFVAGAAAGVNHAEEQPWANAGEFLHAVRQRAVTHGSSVDPRLRASIQATTALGGNETIDSEGGILVNPEIASDLLMRTYQTGVVTSRCDTIPMGTSRLRIPRVNETSRKNGQRYGGITVYRIAEAGLYTPTTSKLDELELNANKAIGLTYLTEELQMDANRGALNKWIFDIFPQAFGFRFDTEALAGTGAGQFLGAWNSGVPVVVNPSVPNALPPTTQDVLNMWARLYGPSRPNACWYVNQDVEPGLLQLTLGSGTAVELLYLPPGFKGNNSKYATLMGAPVIPIEQASTVGTLGDISLMDMSEYLIGNRGDMRQDSSIHVAFLTGQEAFRWMIRNDGQPKWKTPLIPYNGTNTLSPFVLLGPRT